MRGRPRLAALVIAPAVAAALLAACNDSTAPGASGAGGGGRGGGAGAGGSGGGAGAGGTGGGAGAGGTAGGGGGGAAGTGGAGGASAGAGGASAGAGGASANPDGGGGPPTDCPWRSTWATTTVATPFAAPNATLTFAPPNIPCALFPITSYGAIVGSTASSTSAFRQAVAAATAAGGGVVVVPAGRWLTGAITLASNVELHLAAGATVAFSQSTADYLPAVLTRWEGLDVMNWSPFVYARDAHDVALTGPGTLDGQGSSWWGWKLTGAAENQRVYDYYVARLQANGTLPTPLPAPPMSAVAGGLRPSLVECNACTNFLVDGIRTQNAPYWTLHPLYSTNVVIRNATITSNPQGSNGDGVDVDSCRNVLIERDSFDTSDDIISIKSGLNEDGIAVARPSERIVIRDITATAGHALSLGSEMSGGIADVWVTSSGGAGARNTLAGMQHLLRVKTLPGRGGVVQNVWYENVAGSDWGTYAVELTTRYQSSTIPPHNTALLPAIRNVTIRNVSGQSALRPALNLAGLAQAPFQGVLFDGVTLSGAGPNACATVSGGVSVTASTISGVTGAAIACP